MKKRICIALALLLVVALAGCGAKKETETAGGFVPALDTQASGSIRVAGHYSNFEALESAFEDFNGYYPNVKLSYTKLDDYNNTIQTALEGKDAPNIYMAFSWMIGREIYDPVFEHAENLADPALGLDLDCIRPNILSRLEDGTLAMVPVFSTTYGMLVNNDLFKKEGLEVPATYDELVAVCQTLREKGYPSPVMGYNLAASTSMLFSMAYPYFCTTIMDDAEAVAALNRLEPSAGERMRPALELTERCLADGYADLSVCDTLEDNYEALILRFFEGSVPMMICSGDTVSGTRKRESQSEAFTESPFSYTFVPVPLDEKGGCFLDTSSLQFAVNKDCEDLDMTNEFMRFLITPAELGKMAEIKRLVSPTTDLTMDSVYAPFGAVPAERVFSPEAFGLMDDPMVQFRCAAYAVGNGTLSIDEAIAAFGSLE